MKSYNSSKIVVVAGINNVGNDQGVIVKIETNSNQIVLSQIDAFTYKNPSLIQSVQQSQI